MKSPIVPAGRLDIAVKSMLEVGLRMHGSPTLRIAARMAQPQISQALEEVLGPGSKAGEAAAKLVAAASEFERRFLEAHRQIQSEDGP